MRIISTIVLIVLFLAYPFNGQGQKLIDKHQLVSVAEDTLYFDAQWDSCTKEQASYFRVFGSFSNDGLWPVYDYFITGELQFQSYSTVKSRNSINHGKAIWYHKNGDTSAIVTYQNGVKNGAVVLFYPGNVRRESYNIVNDSYYGESILNYPWGLPNQIRQYENGYETGIQITFSIFGDTASYTVVNDNDMVEKEVTYFPNGKKKDITTIDKHESAYRRFHENGQIAESYKTNDFILEGEYAELNEVGDTIIRAFFRGISPEKYMHEFEALGSQFKKEMIRIDNIEYWKVYRDNVLILEGDFKNFYRSGYGSKWKIYSVDGKTILQTIDYNDESIEPLIESDYSAKSELQELKYLFQPGPNFTISQTYWRDDNFDMEALPSQYEKVHPFKMDKSMPNTISGNDQHKRLFLLKTALADSEYTRLNKVKKVDINGISLTYIQPDLGYLNLVIYFVKDSAQMKEVLSTLPITNDVINLVLFEPTNILTEAALEEYVDYIKCSMSPAMKIAFQNDILDTYEIGSVLAKKTFNNDDFWKWSVVLAMREVVGVD